MPDPDDEELTSFEEAALPSNNTTNAPEGDELTDAEITAVLASKNDPLNATNAVSDAN